MMPKRTLLFFILLSLPLMFPNTPLSAQEDTLRVVVKPLEPFVMGSGSDLSGFSIDLWQEIAQHLQLDFRYIEVETVIYERIYRFWFGSMT